MKKQKDGYKTLRVAAISVVAIVVALLTQTACNTTGCSDNRSSIPQAGFYSSLDMKAISLDSIDVGGIGAPDDSLLVHSGERAKAVYLPLRQTADEASFFIAYRYEALDYPELVDTITLRYRSIPYFASEECGAMLRYRIEVVEYTRHIVDSVAVIPADSVITNVAAENMKIFFRTES